LAWLDHAGFRLIQGAGHRLRLDIRYQVLGRNWSTAIPWRIKLVGLIMNLIDRVVDLLCIPIERNIMPINYQFAGSMEATVLMTPPAMGGDRDI
jgi:hypothetical protein